MSDLARANKGSGRYLRHMFMFGHGGDLGFRQPALRQIKQLSG
jgi:hypothetical protein